MAVLEILPGVEVTVEVGGQKAEEYDDPNHPDQNGAGTLRTCTKYIESKTDAHFAVTLSVQEYPRNFHDGKSNRVIVCYIYTDGVRREGAVLQTLPLRETFTGARYYMTEGVDELRLFKFTSVNIVENATQARIEQDSKIAKELGTIRVKLCAHLLTSTTGTRSPEKRFPLENPNFELAEKSLKGNSVSHGTSLSPGALVPAPPIYHTGYRKHMGTFTFKYRSKEALQYELVIPRSPRNPSLSPLPDLDAMAPESLRNLARELLRERGIRRKAPHQGIKRERRESNGGLEQPRHKMVRTADGKEAIDLTEDSN